MKTTFYSALICMLMTCSLAMASHSPAPKGRYTKEKKINKEFKVNVDALLNISNKYGDLNLTSWNENRIVIEVHITTNGDNEEAVTRRLEEIQVNFENNPSQVSAETIVDRENRSWWSSWGKNDNINMEINYEVKLPVTNAVNLSNDYGGIYLDKLEGQAKISCDYGQLELGELLADNNVLNFDYTNNSNIEYMKSGEISADYSDYKLQKAEYIKLSADYTKSNFGTVQELHFSCDYGNLNADNLKNIEGQGDYLNIRLEKVSGNVSLQTDYGAIKIEKLMPEAGNIDITTEYASVKLGYDPDYHFKFSIDLEYADLSGEEYFELITKRVEPTDKYYEGYYGRPDTPNTIHIESEYGGVSFEKR